jgi:HD domain
LFERPLYRTRQLIGGLRVGIDDPARSDAAQLLGLGLLPLFESMSARDQRHSLSVYRKLRDEGHRDPDLLVASLLHDCGKGRLAGVNVRLWHRVAYVLLAARAPWALRRLANGRNGLAALHGHAERGALLAEALGASSSVVDLIRRHEDADPVDRRLQLLRVADDSC